MKLSKEIILERFERTEAKRADYLLLAEEYEKMWRLDPGFKDTREQAIAEGREQVVLPTPFNVVNLSQRLLSGKPRINVIPEDLNDIDSVRYSEDCEKWLHAFWKRINRDQKRNVLGDAIWYNLVMGRFAFEVKWIEEALPKLKRKTMLPIQVRALDPRNVGSWAGDYYTEWVYHTYNASLLEITHKWPELANAPVDSRLGGYLQMIDDTSRAGEDITVRVVDFWYVSKKDGSIWNCILVEDEFAKEPMRTDYPDLPIIVGRGDYGVNMGEEWDGLSILHPLKGLWQYECRLVSQMATGLLWHFWPAILIETEGDGEDIVIEPGTTTPVPPGTSVQPVTIDPNVRLSDTVYGHIDNMVQQSTYPNVMYGQEPGSLQAGYGISLLSDAASGRIKNFAEALEMTLSYVNSFVLALIAEFADGDVVIGGYDDQNGDKVRLTLDKEMASGNYDIEVKIKPNLPSDDQALVTLGLRVNEAKKISDQTFRDKFLDIEVPSDEAKRIALEEFMQSDEMRPWRLRTAAEQYYGEEAAMTMMMGTDLMPPAPEGYHWMQDEYGSTPYLMADNDPAMGPPPAPEGPPGMPPPGMPPPGMGPPGMGPGGPPPIQPPGIQGPMGGNMLPPAMMGQLEPEMLGLPPQGAPLPFAEMTGQPLPPGEELALLGGM